MDTPTPTPTPSYPPGCKPLSIELRAKILAASKGITNTRHLTEPSKVLDPDDETTWRRFEIPARSLFSPVKYPPLLDQKIEGIPLFELYSITIVKLDPLRDFSAIHMRASNTSFIPTLIYKLPPGQSTPPLDSPLPVTNLFRVPSAVESVTIALSNPRSWSFFYYPLYPEEIVYGYFKKEIQDEYTESKAVIEYELIEKAAIVQISVQFECPDNSISQLEVQGGCIAIGNRYDKELGQLVKEFSSPVLVHTEDVLPLDRSIFAVPMDSFIDISVRLDYMNGIDEESIVLTNTTRFRVPKMTSCKEALLTSGHEKRIALRVKLNWFDPLGY